MGRLIDADELKTTFGISGDETSCRNCKYLGLYGCRKEIPISDVCCFIDDAPTIDAIPISWINDWYDRYMYAEVGDLLNDWMAERKEEWKS